jgi:multiple sugar transport system permease protein
MTAVSLPLARDAALSRSLRGFTARAGVTLLALALLAAFLMPLGYMVATSLKDKGQISDPTAPPYPASAVTFRYEGEDYPLVKVPLDGTIRELALVVKGRESSQLVDPSNAAAGLIAWQGRWRTLETVYRFDPRISNFGIVWDTLDFPKLLRNTVLIALLSTVGAVGSSIAVAYGFSRFRFPGRGPLMIILISTIILPFQVTLIPSYIAFTAIGWTGTWLPLIIPHWFANAYNVFLLRQYFLTIPRDLDEAAMIDGAGPFRILRSVIVPQAIPAIVAVALFHFFFAWNEFFLSLVYVGSNPDLQPLSVGIQQFNAVYSAQPNLIQASAILTLAVPVLIFFLAQRAFVRGVVITGVEK